MKLCCADTTVYNWMLHADVSQDIILKGLFILHDAHATVSFMSSTTAHMSRWIGGGSPVFFMACIFETGSDNKSGPCGSFFRFTSYDLSERLE